MDPVIKIVRPRLEGDLILMEFDANYCRSTVTALAGSGSDRTIPQFAVTGEISIGALSAALAALGTNTGNPTVGAITVAAGTAVGEYDVAMEDATHFIVLAPPTGDGAGQEVSHGVFGTAFSAGGLGFTITAGGTPCVAGDSFKLTVTDAGAATDADGKYKHVQLDLTATNGAQIASGIAIHQVIAPNGVDNTMDLLRRGPLMVRREELILPAGITTPQTNLVYAQLEARGILARVSG